MNDSGESGQQRIQVPLVSDESLISTFSLEQAAEELLRQQSEVKLPGTFGSPSFTFAQLLPRIGVVDTLLLSQEKFEKRVQMLQQVEMLQRQGQGSDNGSELAMLQQTLKWIHGKEEKV